jgi:hypothetical protein
MNHSVSRGLRVSVKEKTGQKRGGTERNKHHRRSFRPH